MLSKFLKAVSLMALIVFSGLITDNQFNNPYQGNVMVESFDEKELKKRALNQVMIKVSGNTDIGSLDEAKQLHKKSQQLISQFGYRKVQGTEYFSAVFDQRKINQSLKDMQQPVWGDTRPVTLIWLINNNTLVSDNTIKQNDDAPLSWSLQQTERERGIQMQFPLMDLDDNLALSASDIRGRFYDQIGEASSRYALAHVVIAEFKAINTEKWALSWQLIQTNNPSKQPRILITERFVGGKASISKKMVNVIADYYASQYAILENKGAQFAQTLHINGINSLAKLTKLNSVLNDLFSVSSFTIVSVEGENVNVEVKIKGGLNSFKNALIVQPNLQLDSSLRAVVEEKILPNDTESAENPENDILTTKDTVASVKIDALYFNWR
jgi:uncharacterized protein